jgi:hypothetical protein
VVTFIFHAIDSIALQAKETGIYTALAKKITTTNEKLYFINQLPTDITKEEMLAIDKEFDFKFGKLKIAGSWLTLSIKTDTTKKANSWRIIC